MRQMAQNKFWSVDDVIYMGYFQEKLFKKGKSNMKIIIERLLNFWASKNKPSIPCPPSDPSSKKNHYLEVNGMMKYMQVVYMIINCHHKSLMKIFKLMLLVVEMVLWTATHSLLRIVLFWIVMWVMEMVL